MKKHKYEIIQEMVSEVLEHYKHSFNKSSEDEKIDFNLTITHHSVPTSNNPKIKSKKIDTAYLRLERVILDKENSEVKDTVFVYNNIYKFKNKGEITNPQIWKLALYKDMYARLLVGGIQYAELVQQAKQREQEQQKEEVDG